MRGRYNLRTAVPAPPRWNKGDRLGRYELLRPLGEGGAAEVWQATEHGELGFRKPVALKLLKDTSHSGRVAELLKEARLVASIAHPNVVGIREVADYDDGIYVAMEFVDGGTLKGLMDWLGEARLAMPASVATAIGCDILRALDAAHNARGTDGQPYPIIHRDLKPANVLLARAGIAKVADFGLAKTQDDTVQTMQGKLKGTPAYLPPESWSGSREFLPTMDLFTVGAILYELVTGERLFPGNKIPEIFGLVFSRTAEDEIKPILKQAPALAPVILRLLQRNPLDRYQSAADALAELEAVHARVDVGCDLATFMALLPAKLGAAGMSSMPTIRFPSATDARWQAFLSATAGKEVPLLTAPPPVEPPRPRKRKKKRRRKTKPPPPPPAPAWKNPLVWVLAAVAVLVAVLGGIWAAGA